MSTRVEKTLLVNVPVSRAYNQWTQFEEFPKFMGGVQSVTQLSDDRLEWVAEIAGVRRQWEARILEQVPDRKVAWAATEGATNAGAVTFDDVGGDQTSVSLVLEYDPEGLVEKQAEKDLERFKEFIESEGYATGAWRGSVESTGTVGTPGVEDAAASRGDSGKAGVSGKVAAAGVAAAAAATAAVVGARSGTSGDTTVEGTSADAPVESVESVEVVEPVQPVGTTSVDSTPVATSTGGTAGVGDGGVHLLTDEEIEAGASDVPLQVSDQGEAERDLGSSR